MESNFLKKDREFVIPGDEIIKSMDFLPGRNAFREGDSIYSRRLGLVSVNNRVVSVIPLNGIYIPKRGDMVIGKIDEIQATGWVVDIFAPYMAYLPLSGVKEFIDTSKTSLSRYYDVGDYIYAQISSSNGDSIHISTQNMRCRKFRDGRIMRINPTKVPRVIGKDGSMITMIKNKTGCRISIGQNGLVWVQGEKDNLILKILKLIEQESHRDGLTDKISQLLGETKK